MEKTDDKQKTFVDWQFEAMDYLENNIDKKLRRKITKICAFGSDDALENKGATVIAIAKLKDGRYIMASPEYFTEEQLSIYDDLFYEEDHFKKILVINKRDYDAIKKYSNGRKVELFMYHSEEELRKNYAGEYIEEPENLPENTYVTVFEKGTKDWWEHGNIYTREDGTRRINCFDGEYNVDEVEIYIDTRYI